MRSRGIRRIQGLTIAAHVFLIDLDDPDLLRRPGKTGDTRAPARDPRTRRRRQALSGALRIVLEDLGGSGAAHAGIRRARSGKPTLIGCGLGYSLAHAGGQGVIAVGRGAIGVDIEMPRPLRIAPERRMQILDAGALFGALHGPDDLRFIRAWTRLEAVAKATGAGIGATLGTFGVRAHAGRADLLGAGERARSYGLVVRDVPLPGAAVAAVAIGARATGRR